MILCRLPEVKNPILCFLLWDPLPGLYCSHLQLMLVCGSFKTASAALPWVIEKKNALLSWNQLTDVGSEEYPISFTQETLGLLLQYVLGNCPLCTVKHCLISFASFVRIWAVSLAVYSSTLLFSSIIMLQVHLTVVSSVQQVSSVFFQNWVHSFWYFLAKSNLVVLFLSVIRGLHIFENNLYFHSRRSVDCRRLQWYLYLLTNA